MADNRKGFVINKKSIFRLFVVFLLITLNRNTIYYGFVDVIAPKSTALCRPIKLSANYLKYENDSIPLLISGIRDMDMKLRPKLYNGCENQKPIEFLPKIECPKLPFKNTRACIANPVDLVSLGSFNNNKVNINNWIEWAYGTNALSRFRFLTSRWLNFIGGREFWAIKVKIKPSFEAIKDSKEAMKNIMDNDYDVLIFDSDYKSLSYPSRDEYLEHMWQALYSEYPIRVTGQYNNILLIIKMKKLCLLFIIYHHVYIPILVIMRGGIFLY